MNLDLSDVETAALTRLSRRGSISKLHLVAGAQPAARGADKDVAGAGIVAADDEAEWARVVEKFGSALKNLGQTRSRVTWYC
jgi:hypothetical protein